MKLSSIRTALVLCLLGILCSSLASQGRAGELVLFSEGRTAYQIVVPDSQPSPELAECLRQTARLLQISLQGKEAPPPVVVESERDAAKPSIYLGATEFAKRQGVDVAKLRDWSYVQRVVGQDVMLAGHDHPPRGQTENPRRPNWSRVGTAKAAVDFARQYLGTRFLYPEIAPYNSVAAVARIDLASSPAIEFLRPNRVAIPDNLDVMKTPLLRLNTSHPAGGGFYDLAHNRFPRVDEVFGGHTWERAAPPAKYWSTHPEYFAFLGGSRLKPVEGNAQYCLSNPEFQELVYQDLASWLDRGYASVDLGQPDGFRECECDACKNLYDTGKDWSEKIWIFHRELAERLAKSHPGREVTMMSYILTAQPPKSFKAFPENTCIMLTGTNEEDFAPWREIEAPRGFTGYVYNWCPNLATRYTPMRTPGFIEQQVKRLAANRIQSLYRDGPGQLFGLEGPVYYVMGRMFDDPDSNSARALLPEYCDAAFVDKGAAFHMRSFYDQLYHAIALYSDHIGTRCDVWTYEPISGEGRPRKTVQDPFQLLAFLYTPTLLAALDTDLSLAEKLVKTEKARTRLRLVRTEFDYVRHLARVVHLYHAYQILPDAGAKDRLLDAIDARNAFIASLYDERGNGRLRDDWGQVLFPFPGHDAKHLRLAYDGYQEPYSHTCLNWDTAAMRRSPAIGVKKWTIGRSEKAVTLDSPAWQSVASQELTYLPPLKRLPRRTSVQSLYDAEYLYLRAECELEPDHPAGEFPKAQPDRPLVNHESLDVYLQPRTGQEVFYRFQAGVHPDAKYDAASGFVTDPIDPRFGKDDPTWNGNWTVESKLERESRRWIVMFAIPFRSLDVDPPASGITWRMNLARYHHLPREQIDRSLWSTRVGTNSIDDREAFGELTFGP
ncbi:MAG: DUF4838 domain-containing protein [Pirellulales bacterium]